MKASGHRVKRIEVELHGDGKGYTMRKHFEQSKGLHDRYVEPEESAHSSHKEVMETMHGHMDSDGDGGDCLYCIGDDTAAKSGDKKNLTKHGYDKKSHNSPAHPGFKAVSNKIASKEGISHKAAAAILAASSRHASAAAHKANPRLNRVKG